MCTHYFSRCDCVLSGLPNKRIRYVMLSSVCVVGVQLDVNGECETKYVIKSRESSSLSSVSDMLVSKVKNLDKCTKRNSFELGLFAGLPHYDTEKVRRRPRRVVSPLLACTHLGVIVVIIIIIYSLKIGAGQQGRISGTYNCPQY